MRLKYIFLLSESFRPRKETPTLGTYNNLLEILLFRKSRKLKALSYINIKHDQHKILN